MQSCRKNISKICNPICGTNLLAIAGFGIAIWLLISSKNEPDIYKNKCNELNCTVHIVDGECYAKIDNTIGYDFEKVKCDKKRDDIGYFVLPCDVGQYGMLKINCDIKNTDKKGNIVASIFLLILSILVGIVSIIFTILMVCREFADSDTSGQNITGENPSTETSQNITIKLDETSDQSHEKNTGSKYAKFDL